MTESRLTPEASARQPVRTLRSRRRHPATASRIAAAGLGTTTMFGIVAALGLHEASAVTAEPLAMPDTVPTAVTAPTTGVIPAPDVPATLAATVAAAPPAVQVVTPLAPAAIAPLSTAPAVTAPTVTVPPATTSGSS